MRQTQLHVRKTATAAALMACIALSAFLGCQKARTNADFIPSQNQSLEALKAALDAWKAGTPSGPVPGTSPVVHITDSSRVAGQTLDDYEILGDVPGNAPRCIAVKLKLSNPAEEKRERFIIVGIDPLWIFRHEDYDLLLHWEHQMPTESKQVPATSPLDAKSEVPEQP
ncbi:MAG: hypothetical protein H7Z17_08535 [Fuerstia sp.]|nr:hypothetical protein [Fuerstiella sp.]